MLWEEALLDAQKVIDLDPSSYHGYQLKHAALHGTKRYDEAIEAFQIMLSKLDDAPEEQTPKLLGQQHVSPSEAAEVAIRKAVWIELDNAPLRLLNVTTGLLCDRAAQINDFKMSAEYKELLLFTTKHSDLQTEHIVVVVATYFRCVLLSHRWENMEVLLHDVQDKVVYELNGHGGTVKLQSFCKIARDLGYRWAWMDTCCINKTSNTELQESINSMLVWYRHSALTIVYLHDVPPSSQSGALAMSEWNRRGWTIPEIVAPKVVLFYQNDWTPYLDDHSPNHKESTAIMQELMNATGIGALALVDFRPGMTCVRETLRWASIRCTTRQEDIAYSLLGIFGITLPLHYGEGRNALGRLLREIIALSGDITALDWVGQSSEYHSCFPANLSSYNALPCTLPHFPEDETQTLVSSLRNVVTAESASTLYTLLRKLSPPDCRLRLPCTVFHVIAISRRRGQDKQTNFTYEVKADGLHDLLITTDDKLLQWTPARPTRETFLLIRPWNRHPFELPILADDIQRSEPEVTLHESLGESLKENKLADSDSHSRALRLLVRLAQPFGAFLLVQQRSGVYKRIASDHDIIAQVKDVTSANIMMDVRKLTISPDDISYNFPLYTPPSLSEDEIQTSVSKLQRTVTAESASKLYTLLDNLNVRFPYSILQLPCIAFPVTEVIWRHSEDMESYFTYEVKADGLQDLLITTENKLVQFSRARPTPQTFLLIRPWNGYDLELPKFVGDAEIMNESEPESPLDDSPGASRRENELVDLNSQSRELRLIVRLGQPFGALLLAEQRRGEYKRIASDHEIIAQVKNMTSVSDMMDVRTVEIV